MMLPVAILAGGLATRLRPITETVPKALVNVAGEPFIARQLRYLSKQGITRVVLCVGYLGDQIQTVVGDGSHFGLQVDYSPDGLNLLGTGGALRKAMPLLGDKFFVLYGDSYLPVDFHPIQVFFEQQQRTARKHALMTIFQNNNHWDKSNVIFENDTLIEYNKRIPRPEMNYIDYGLGILTAQTLINYPSDQALDLADVYHKLSLEGTLAGYEVVHRFYEIGSHTGLTEANAYFTQKEIK